MHRRYNAFLCLVAASGIVAAAETGPGPASWVGDLAPIGPADWNYDRASYLLERAGFGGTPEEIQALAAMSPHEAVRSLVYYQNVQDVALPPFHESGIFPSRDWAAQGVIRPLYTMVMGTYDKLPPEVRAVYMDPAATGVTEEMRRIAKTDKQAVNDGFFRYTFADRAETQRLE